jgi:nucleolar complex protein 2
MPPSKSTKKFEKNRLHDVLKSRKAVSKIKQKHQITAKRKLRKAQDNEPANGVEGANGVKSNTKDSKNGDLGEMSMDQFFQGGFQLPEMSKKSAGKPKTGKRKRTPVPEEEQGGTSDSDEEMAEAAPTVDDSGSDSDSGDDADAHKEQLAALADKDPEFYKYLKDNDAELLDFAEEADLEEIDALSASEDEKTPRKKQKATKASKVEKDESEEEEEEESGDNEVTKKVIDKWRSSMETAHSLRAMKEVALAFRAAAHLNDDGGKSYKYSISDPNGMFNLSVTDLVY